MARGISLVPRRSWLAPGVCCPHARTWPRVTWLQVARAIEVGEGEQLSLSLGGVRDSRYAVPCDVRLRPAPRESRWGGRRRGG